MTSNVCSKKHFLAKYKISDMNRSSISFIFDMYLIKTWIAKLNKYILWIRWCREMRVVNDFFKICQTPELACEITLQPIRWVPTALDNKSIWLKIFSSLIKIIIEEDYEKFPSGQRQDWKLALRYFFVSRYWVGI